MFEDYCWGSGWLWFMEKNWPLDLDTGRHESHGEWTKCDSETKRPRSRSSEGRLNFEGRDWEDPICQGDGGVEGFWTMTSRGPEGLFQVALWGSMRLGFGGKLLRTHAVQQIWMNFFNGYGSLHLTMWSVFCMNWFVPWFSFIISMCPCLTSSYIFSHWLSFLFTIFWNLRIHPWSLHKIIESLARGVYAEGGPQPHLFGWPSVGGGDQSVSISNGPADTWLGDGWSTGQTCCSFELDFWIGNYRNSETLEWPILMPTGIQSWVLVVDVLHNVSQPPPLTFSGRRFFR